MTGIQDSTCIDTLRRRTTSTPMVCPTILDVYYYLLELAAPLESMLRGRDRRFAHR
jgi:hypothetical protein